MDETRQCLRGVILAWEKLRVVYNLVLVVQGLTWVSAMCEVEKVTEKPYYRVSGASWAYAVLFGMVANAFYCVGPLAEAAAYRLFGWRMARARYFLFAAGLLLSMGLELALLRRLLYHLAGYLR